MPRKSPVKFLTRKNPCSVEEQGLFLLRSGSCLAATPDEESLSLNLIIIKPPSKKSFIIPDRTPSVISGPAWAAGKKTLFCLPLETGGAYKTTLLDVPIWPDALDGEGVDNAGKAQSGRHDGKLICYMGWVLSVN